MQATVTRRMALIVGLTVLGACPMAVRAEGTPDSPSEPISQTPDDHGPGAGGNSRAHKVADVLGKAQAGAQDISRVVAVEQEYQSGEIDRDERNRAVLGIAGDCVTREAIEHGGNLLAKKVAKKFTGAPVKKLPFVGAGLFVYDWSRGGFGHAVNELTWPASCLWAR